MAVDPGCLSSSGLRLRLAVTTHLVAKDYSGRSHSHPTLEWNGMLHALGVVEWETRYQVGREQLRCHNTELGIISDGPGIPLSLANPGRTFSADYE